MRKKITISLLIGTDIILMYLALSLSLWIRNGMIFQFQYLKNIAFHFSIIYCCWILYLYLLDGYEIPTIIKKIQLISNLTIFLCLANLTGIAYFYLYASARITPKTILFLNSFSFCIFLALFRYGVYFLSKNFKEKIIYIGLDKNLLELPLETISKTGYEIVTVFNPDQIKTAELEEWLTKIPTLTADISKLKAQIEKEHIHIVVLAPKIRECPEMVQKIYSDLPPCLHYISFDHFYETLTKKILLSSINKIWFLENISSHKEKFPAFIKRSMDILLASLGLVVTIVLLPLIALSIKMNSRGTIFYSQKRIGKDSKVFILHKFRTMRFNAEENGPQWTIPNDSRVTIVGKVLRKFYLDELPQFFNVLKGDLSMVGPRPERPEFVEQLKNKIAFYEIRHLAKPGLTGWAQVNYPASSTIEETKEKFCYDLYYLKNRSLLLDINILLKTFQTILS
ncbi:MAG: sugar transferase [Elusimicrobia bacterium]|nr:sugar transferase [Elusimicrobiota bacterium]